MAYREARMLILPPKHNPGISRRAINRPFQSEEEAYLHGFLSHAPEGMTAPIAKALDTRRTKSTGNQTRILKVKGAKLP